MLPLLEGEKIKWLHQRCMRTWLSILPYNAACSFIIIKNNQSNTWKKHTAPFKYVVKYVLLNVIAMKLCKTLDIGTRVK